MKKVLIFVRNKIVFLGAIILAAMVGGLTTAAVMAAIPDSDGQINACYKNSTSVLAVTDPAGNCAANETPLSWQQSAGGRVYSGHVSVPNGSQSATPLLSLPGFGNFSVTLCEFTDGFPNMSVTFTNTSSSTIYAGENPGNVAPEESVVISGIGDQMNMLSDATLSNLKLAGVWSWGYSDITSETGGTCTARILVTVSE
jgi:hypothetical protein